MVLFGASKPGAIMESWRCDICGKAHGELLMDVAFQRPQLFFEVPEEERGERVWMDADTNADLCVIDGSVFLIRAFLPIPAGGEQIFRLGVWVRVDEEAFRTYHSYGWDADTPPVYGAHLESEVPGYPSTRQLGATVKLRGHQDRPVVYLDAADHPLALEQANGITMSRVHEILQRCLPELFGDSAPPN
jgi:hypothetical protein